LNFPEAHSVTLMSLCWKLREINCGLVRNRQSGDMKSTFRGQPKRLKVILLFRGLTVAME
jgi:hypothetical protein